MRVAFLHPDLGIGGAERLVVDAAMALVEHGHDVDVYTSHYSPDRCFEETRSGSFSVSVFGDFLPRHCCHRLHIFFAILRNIWLAICVSFMSLFCCAPVYDVAFCDQISLCVPILRLLSPRTRILFYCHYPDQLLSVRDSVAKRIYRIPFDVAEEVTTALADRVVVNSKFTRGVYERTFRCVAKPAEVLYPCVPLAQFQDVPPIDATPAGEIVFLSINRFERKKGIDLAVHAFVELKKHLASDEYARVRLILAGGYDTRVQENVEYFEEISAVVAEGGVEDRVEYKRSFSDAEKLELLARCTAVAYTPKNEHFGIVPVEAMAAARPVIATNTGGPLESVADGETGFLCPVSPDAFAKAMAKLVRNPSGARDMGIAGRERAERLFSRRAFGEQLNAHCGAIRDASCSARSFLGSAVLCSLPIAAAVAAAPHMGYLAAVAGARQ